MGYRLQLHVASCTGSHWYCRWSLCHCPPTSACCLALAGIAEGIPQNNELVMLILMRVVWRVQQLCWGQLWPTLPKSPKLHTARRG